MRLREVRGPVLNSDEQMTKSTMQRQSRKRAEARERRATRRAACCAARDCSAATVRATRRQSPEGCARLRTEAKRAHTNPTASTCKNQEIIK